VAETFVPILTPFPMDTGAVRTMLEIVEQREGRDFGGWFCERPRDRWLTEFALYGAFLAANPGGLARWYADGGMRKPVVWKGSDELGAMALQRARTEGVFAVHRTAFRDLEPRLRLAIARFWCERRIFDSEAEALVFLNDCARDYA
jgi:hypothetical protein